MNAEEWLTVRRFNIQAACWAIAADGCLSGHLLLSRAGQAPRVAERPPQQELNLGIGAPQVIRGPPSQGFEDLGVQAQEKGLPFAHV
jgi:hypothetical protein